MINDLSEPYLALRTCSRISSLITRVLLSDHLDVIFMHTSKLKLMNQNCALIQQNYAKHVDKRTKSVAIIYRNYYYKYYKCYKNY